MDRGLAAIPLSDADVKKWASDLTDTLLSSSKAAELQAGAELAGVDMAGI